MGCESTPFLRSFLLDEHRLTHFSTPKTPTSAHFSTSFPHFVDNFSTLSCLFHQKSTSFPPIFCDFSTFYPHSPNFSTGFPQVIHICDGLGWRLRLRRADRGHYRAGRSVLALPPLQAIFRLTLAGAKRLPFSQNYVASATQEAKHRGVLILPLLL